MRDETARRLIGQARAELGTPPEALACEVAAARYRDEAWLARELAVLFRGPRVIAASSSLAPGSCRPYDEARPDAEGGTPRRQAGQERQGQTSAGATRRGQPVVASSALVAGPPYDDALQAGRAATTALLPDPDPDLTPRCQERQERQGQTLAGATRRTPRSLILVRDADGRARAFYNACRHRATRLVDAPRDVKALVCPYHGWTYDLAGSLIHMPHAEAFACAKRDLIEVPLYERHGLLWLGGENGKGSEGGGSEGRMAGEDLADYLGELDGDLAALDLGSHVVFREARVTRACNWKLLIEAFLDGYHIRVLHRDSIYRFFVDAASVAERVGPHIRAVTARRALREASADLAEPAAQADPRALVTPSFVLFPSTVIIAHPDFVSVVTVLPLAPDRMDYHHMMLVPAVRAQETEHWAKSWALIEETVFQREDLWACEQMQRGLSSGATDHLLFGGLEHAVAWFHAELERRLAG